MIETRPLYPTSDECQLVDQEVSWHQAASYLAAVVSKLSLEEQGTVRVKLGSLSMTYDKRVSDLEVLQGRLVSARGHLESVRDKLSADEYDRFAAVLAP